MTSERQQISINLKPVFDALETPLSLIDNGERRQQFEQFIANSRIHQEKAVVDLLSDLLQSLNDAGGGRASLEVRDGGYFVNFSAEQPPVFDSTDEVERVTLRLPRQLKTFIDQEAEQSGQSTNSWYVRTLSRAIAHSVRNLARRAEDTTSEHRGRHHRGRRRRNSSDDTPASPA